MSITASTAWDMAHLLSFVTVARTGSLKSASSVLGIPQPAISRHIAKLEAQCNGRLFGRTGRGMTLTELGTRVFPRVETLLADAGALSQEVAESAGIPFGDVRIGALPSHYLTIIVPLVLQMRRSYPGIKLHIFEGSGGQIDQWLVSGHLDIGMPYRYGKPSPSDADTLITLGSCLIGPAGDTLTQAGELPFARLDRLPLVLPSAPSGVRMLLDQLAKRANIALNVIVEADSTQLQKAIVETGEAYTVLPRHPVAAELKTGRLQAATLVDPVIERRVVLAMTAVRPSSLAVRTVAAAARGLYLSEAVQRAMQADADAPAP
ncbi:LysR family transcriptional regulator [Bordetella petrii]|nr:LysR family transcriptional regulator [Bordetella petrii]